ncbi:MAG: C45 family peptidase [Actinobacteria bacterium]|nr:C45 family peptidase [Actinomycetota bacterium]MBU1942891.1 C45 family peptidase [Actinomycetota bacterium]MBU2687623.1 C45 family peptidase [Actinomycetota bacterium]
MSTFSQSPGPAIDVFEPSSDYEFGLAAGRERPGLYRQVVRRGMALWRWHLSRAHGPQPSALAHRRIASDIYPSSLERLEGIARATGLDQDELVATSGVIGGMLVPRCTNFAAAPPATGDDGAYVSWNVDLSLLFRLLLGRMPLFVVRLPDRKPYVAFGIPALVGIGVLNSEGLSMAANAVGMTDGGDGMHAAELNNMAMETCSTVDEAIRVYSDNPRETFVGSTVTILLNSNTTWGDAPGSIATLEYSHNHVGVGKTDRGILAEANHHQYLDRSLSGGVDPGEQAAIAGSFARLGRMWSLLEQYHGQITPRIGRLIVSDHGTDYSLLEPYGISRPWYQTPIDDATICAHHWNALDYVKKGRFMDALVVLATSCTVYQMMISPRALSVYYCLGWPCRHPHVPLDFSALLDAEPSMPELVEAAPAPRARLRTSRPYVTSFAWPLSTRDAGLRSRFRRVAERLDGMLDIH